MPGPHLTNPAVLPFALACEYSARPTVFSLMELVNVVPSTDLENDGKPPVGLNSRFSKANQKKLACRPGGFNEWISFILHLLETKRETSGYFVDRSPFL